MTNTSVLHSKCLTMVILELMFMLVLKYTEIWLFLQMFTPHNRNIVFVMQYYLLCYNMYVRVMHQQKHHSALQAVNKSMDS